MKHLFYGSVKGFGLRGLSVPRLVALLEAGERGDYADIQWLYYYMERSDAVIYSVLQRRRAALLAVDWDIWLLDDGDPGLAREQAALLGEVYDRIDNFRDARVWLNLAKGEIRNRGESGVFGEPALPFGVLGEPALPGGDLEGGGWLAGAKLAARAACSESPPYLSACAENSPYLGGGC